MEEFCRKLRTRYCLNDSNFTETDYFNALETILFNCRRIESLRLYLPFQIIGNRCDTTTMMLANTFKALAKRPDEDAELLKALVLENVADLSMCDLWLNPIDVMNIVTVFADLEHLVLTLRHVNTQLPFHLRFARVLWDIIGHACRLETLCLVCMDSDESPPLWLRKTEAWKVSNENWRARSLLQPLLEPMSNLRCLELKRVEILPELLLMTMDVFGAALEELYLNEVYLKAEQSHVWNQESHQTLWVGIPNERPEEDCQWMAMGIRARLERLRICRASFLGYDLYVHEAASNTHNFDLTDPCGLGRSLSERFVEVVTGTRQPNSPQGDPVEYLPADSMDDYRLLGHLKPRLRRLKVVEYDTNAYQLAVRNPTSSWHKSLDGVFHDCNMSTLDDLRYIADTTSQGMREAERRRRQMASETDGATALPSA